MKMNYRFVAIALGLLSLVLIVASAFLFVSNSSLSSAASQSRAMAGIADHLTTLAGLEGRLNDVHIHTDFLVLVDGKEMGFSRPEFDVKNAFVHLHLDKPDDGGKVIHIEAKGVTLGHFFSSIGMRFTSNCLVADGRSYCSGSGKELALFVNGERNYELDNYVPKNHDKLLVAYGNYSGEELEEFIAKVSDYAKRYG